MNKPVLDVCCGPKMFWFNVHDDRAVFVDNRKETHLLKDKSSKGGFREIKISPDIVADFTKLPFDDETFSLVVFDPPHFKRNGGNGWMNLKYGTLPDNWEEVITNGFSECFRVLKQHGTLVFKWNENEISLKKILSLTPEQPLFGNKYGKHYQSHFIVFIKS